MPPLTRQVIPAVFSGTAYNNNLTNIETAFADLSPYVVAGLVPSIGTGLSVNVTAGNAVITGDIAVGAGFVLAGLADNTLNHLYLTNLGSGTSNTSGTQPANSVKLGTATTSGGVVTAVGVGRASGRQQFQRSDALIPGGPATGIASAGHPASVNLANWAASAAEGIAVYGSLPSGAGGGPPSPTLTPLVNGSYSWVNQGSATETVTSGVTLLRSPSNASENLRLRVKSVPTAPYTVTAALLPITLNSNFTNAGLALRDSAGGGIVTFDQRFNSTTTNVPYLASNKYTNATTFNAAYTLSPLNPLAELFRSGLMWLRIQDDNTNRIFQASANGFSWFTLLSALRTDFITPNQIGYYVESGQGTTVDVGLDLYSWTETQP